MAIDLLTYEFLKKYVEGQTMGDARPRGPWDENQTYSTGDYVTYNNAVYILPYDASGHDYINTKTETPDPEGGQWEFILAAENTPNNNIVIENGIARINANELYLGDRDVLREAQPGANGLMSVEDKTFIDNLSLSINGKENKVGSKAFRIIGYSGINGGNGNYYIDGKDSDLNILSELVFTSEVPIKCTIQNGTWFDNYFTISNVVGTNDGICLSVNNFYSNTGNKGESVEYNPENDYSALGTPDTLYPQLGQNIKDKKATLFICGHPELGSFQFNTVGASFGQNNISQGGQSITSGYNNQALGKYSSAFGNSNKAGYDTHVFGRSNDASMAKDSIFAGYGHKNTDLVNSVAVFGWQNKCGYPYQTICGLWNNNKADNLFEVGGGSYGAPKNMFEVDKYGLISANENYILGQKIYEGSHTISKETKNLINNTNITLNGEIEGIRVTGTTNKTGTLYEFNDIGLGAFVLFNRKTLNLEDGDYYFTVKYNIKQLDEVVNSTLTFNPIVTETVGGPAIGHGNSLKVKYESRVYSVTFPFTVSSDYMEYGLYINNAGGKKFNIMVDLDIRLYKPQDFDNINLPQINNIQNNLISNQALVTKNNAGYCNQANLPNYLVNIRNDNKTLRIIPLSDIKTGETLNVKILLEQLDFKPLNNLVEVRDNNLLINTDALQYNRVYTNNYEDTYITRNEMVNYIKNNKLPLLPNEGEFPVVMPSIEERILALEEKIEQLEAQIKEFTK